jgi:hypothetical protein
MFNRGALALILGVAVSWPLPPGVVVTESAITRASGKTVESQIVYSVKGLSMRVHRNRPDGRGAVGLVHIYDAAAGRLVILDAEHKQADIYDGVKASAEVEKKLPSGRITADLKPTGRTRELLGVACDEYSFLVKAPLAGDVMLARSGTAWIARQGGGLAEYVAFFRAAQNVLVAGSINVPKAYLAIDRSETELYRRIAALGGIPYALDMRLEVEGSGITASLLRKMFTASRTVTTTAVDTTPLDDQVFAIPAGWKTRYK